MYSIQLSPKFERESLNETFKFPFWGLNICVDFDLRDSIKMKNVKKPNEKYLITKILISIKLPNPIRKTRALKLVFIKIPCLKFWALLACCTLVHWTSINIYSVIPDIYIASLAMLEMFEDPTKSWDLGSLGNNTSYLLHTNGLLVMKSK